MNFKVILDQILNLAGTLSPLLKDTPVGFVAPIVEIGKKVLELIDTAEEVLGESDVERLKVLRAEIEPLVLARAEEVANKLRG